jgi:pimeloyl-ACP methyl ester carboxylesterase
MANIIFIHGLESTGHGFKAQFFRNNLPECVTPDFEPFNTKLSFDVLLKNRMSQLITILKEQNSWNIIGSSFGGLMGAFYTLQYPNKVELLILLAPLLAVPELNPDKFRPIDIPVIIFHGKNDKIVSMRDSRNRATLLFKNLQYNVVEDDHMLQSTVTKINWKEIIKP